MAMSESTWFVRGRNKGNERKISLLNATCLVGKAPTKTKRVKLFVQMPLGGNTKSGGVPDWITESAALIAAQPDRYKSMEVDAEFSGFEILMDDDDLFKKAKVVAQKCQMRGFQFCPVGDADDKSVVMKFLIYAPFSAALWKFAGQMCGEEFWARFTQIVEEQSSTELELSGEEVDEEAEEGELLDVEK